MHDKTQEERPRTAGELRRLIAAKGHPWMVDSRLRDSDALPKYARGGKQENPARPDAAPGADLADVLRQSPPANPFLRDRWVELKLLPAEARGPLVGSSSVVPLPAKEEKR